MGQKSNNAIFLDAFLGKNKIREGYYYKLHSRLEPTVNEYLMCGTIIKILEIDYAPCYRTYVIGCLTEKKYWEGFYKEDILWVRVREEEMDMTFEIVDR